MHDPRTGKYLSGMTRDLSCGGLMIDIPRLVNLKEGDKIFVGVAIKRRQGLLLAKEMVEAVVTRATSTVDDHTALAVHFDTHAAVEAADQALRAAA
ncbi:MAG: PilZ domain-containing protein [Phycisphaerales bacterium]|nr:PilZ domain-containing protein [Phycisphaerales bacterium]